jgi:acyl transferase domain-containing protein
MFSTVSGRLHAEAIELSYWPENLISPVKFSLAAVELLKAFPQSVFLEVGTHSQLMGPLRQIAAGEKTACQYIPTMVRFENCMEALLTAAGGRLKTKCKEESNKNAHLLTAFNHFQLFRLPRNLIQGTVRSD